MTKAEVLRILRESGEFVSGEALSRELGVSRAAVNTAVRSLREQGYAIESVTNRGYRLSAAPDLLNETEVASYLPEERMEKVLVYDEITSTNTKLLSLAMDGAADGQTVIADCQSAGRGRVGRGFVSPHGVGIYFSYLIRPDRDAGESFDVTSWLPVTAWTAVAIARAVGTVSGVTPDIKWVNDLQMQGRKICGILTQTDLEAESGAIRAMVVGIGVNVQQSLEDFPEELREIAGSVAMGTGVHVRRAKLAAEMVKEMDRLRASWPGASAEYLSFYKEHCATLGKEIMIHEGQKRTPAAAVSIDPSFGLVVREENGIVRTLSSGEISIRLR